MNKIIFILCNLIFYVGILKGNDSVVVKHITIHYIYSMINTQHDISCNDFDIYQGKYGYMTKFLKTKEQIRSFIISLNRYKTPPLVKHIDVRAKAYIHYSNGKISIACIDRFGDIILDDKFLGVSSELLSFLKKNCKGFD